MMLQCQFVIDAQLRRFSCAKSPGVSDAQSSDIWCLCAISDDEVLLACGAASLRAISFRTAKLVDWTTASAIRNVYKVAFDAHTDTLLLLVGQPRAATTINESRYYQLVSLRRKEPQSHWLEVYRLQTKSLISPLTHPPEITVCDSLVLLGCGGEFGGDTLQMFNVSAEHTVRAAGTVTLDSIFYGQACTRLEGNTLAAFSHERSVSLHLLAPQRPEPLADIDHLIKPSRLLFSEDTCCSSLTETAPTARTASCRCARRADFSLNSECSSTLSLALRWEPGFSRANRLVFWDQHSKYLLTHEHFRLSLEDQHAH